MKMAYLSYPRLPLDVYELIINALDAPGGTTYSRDLYSMCLACRLFVPHCQKRIFASIAHNLSRRLSTFLDVLNLSPHLSGYVRNLYFQFEPEAASASFPDSAATVQVLDKLQNLRSLEIRTDVYSSGYDWNLLDPQVCDALLRRAFSLSLVSLTLNGFNNFPTHGLLGLKNSLDLKSLNLQCIWMDQNALQAIPLQPDVNSSESIPINLLQLSKFSAVHTGASVVDILVGASSRNNAVFNVTRLREFNMVWNDNSDVRLGTSIIEAAFDLENLHCAIPYGSIMNFRGLAESILKGPFRTLRELMLGGATDDVDDPFEIYIAELEQLVRRTERLEALNLTFCYNITDDNDPLDFMCEVIKTNCIALDNRLFSDRDAFPSIRSVSISVVLIYMETSDLLEEKFGYVASGITKQLFPKLKASIPDIKLDLEFDIEG